ncbi:peptide deformylase [Paenarthrobacter sp. Z7-10]|uniref:peptide deformylase n=1 Tax=Paenarthrobacter sp. Z7-10 TaxID=2787635 RepID=UPI0022A95EE0|nr:peptide deformylase [Paenarthrobacter sp. Z7-10]MCZ2404067.1 peptide deformylase [Paenarthrobacter sp. Z7-10]
MSLYPAHVQEMVAALLESDEMPAIVQAGHPVLRQPAAPVEGQLSVEELAALTALMRRVMHEAPGVGLAAPQIGIPLQLAVLEDLYDLSAETAAVRQRTPLEFLAISNPRYRPLDSNTAAFYEGCLSMTGWQAVVERPLRVRLDYDDALGVRTSSEFSGWPARVVQHETDHLAGTLYIDKALTRSLSDDAEYVRRWAEPGIGLAREGLSF